MALSDVTATELAGLVRDQMVGGYDRTEKGEGRRRLLEVVEEIAGMEEETGAEDPLGRREWRLDTVTLRGIGGVATTEPAPLSFTPTPGITVVRAPNGHGKTSLARAIDCALRGSPDPQAEQAGDLWSAALLAEGEDTGTVVLTLVGAAGAQLRIEATFGRSTAAAVSATLTDADGARPVALGDRWRGALAASRAYYSYGALQHRLTGYESLQSYLEELLVLGPVWGRVREAVDVRAARAVSAKGQVDAALRKAQAEERKLAQRNRDSDPEPSPPGEVAWPKLKRGLDLDAWVRDTGLTLSAYLPVVRVSADHEARVAELDAALRDADRRLDDADRAIDEPGVAEALHHLERLVAVDGLDDGTCPLCGSATAWRRHARDLTDSLRDRQQAARAVHDVVTALRSWVEAELVPLLDPEVTGGPHEAVAAFLPAAVDTCHARSVAHRAARPLVDVLTGEVHARWLEGLRAATDATAAWRAALASTVHEFAVEVRAHVDAAAEAGAWRKAQGTLDEVQVGLRQRRQDGVTEKMNGALARMLPDAAVDLGEIAHPRGLKQRRGVDVELSLAGRPGTLGMLSSGQRNALLLTPLLVLDDPRPFGFLLVDDPVHALDDTRVDLLAVEFARLAEERQVIVLTHDPRLEEHVRARHRATSVVELQRDPVSRTVSWSTVDEPWETVLGDAWDAIDAAAADDWRYREPLASVVGGLCRAAVDGAVRQTLINRAVSRGTSVEAELEVAGKLHTTAKRLDHVRRLAGGKAHLPVVEAARQEHLRAWNQGSHGQLDEDAELGPVVTGAEVACFELVHHDWSGS